MPNKGTALFTVKETFVDREPEPPSPSAFTVNEYAPAETVDAAVSKPVEELRLTPVGTVPVKYHVIGVRSVLEKTAYC